VSNRRRHIPPDNAASGNATLDRMRLPHPHEI
jgi:hypothetical protein